MPTKNPSARNRCWLTALVAAIALAGLANVASAQQWSVVSPSGGLQVTVRLADLGATQPYPRGQRLYYRVELRNPARVVLEDSPLGLARDDRSFVDGLSLVAQGDVRTIDERYTLRAGKRRDLRSHAREITLTFAEPGGARVLLDVRAYDDGAAFRYRFAETSEAVRTMTAEETGFRLPEGSVGWLQPYDDPTQYTPAYEAFFSNGVQAGTPSPKAGGWGFPVLFRTGSGAWVLLTEAGLDAGYAGTRLAQESPGRVYRVRFPDPGEGHKHGAVQPSWALPWATPWRVVMAGHSLADIVASSLVTHVSAPSRIADTSWIRPGRVAWDWWSGPHAGPVKDLRRRFVDFAAEMGWEYYLIDANWTDDSLDLIRDIVAYGKEKKVGILLWYNSAGVHNIVTERPRDRLYEREQRRREFQFLKDLGVKGVKIDFFQSDKQASMSLHLDMLQDAADFGLMVNFHGTTIPRGWERTYPNLLSMESVRGAESYRYDASYPEQGPVFHTIVPFTRNVIGSMDYTPVALTDNTHPRRTTDAYELALAVVFESGWLHFADKPEAYRALPESARAYLRAVPAAWDDVRLVAGEPGRYAVIARRSGDTWYVAAINGETAPRTVDLSLPFLGPGRYRFDLIADGDADRQVRSESGTIDRAATRSLVVRPRGGFVAIVRPN